MSAPERDTWTLPNGLRLRIAPTEVYMLTPEGEERVLAYSRSDARALAMAIWAGVNPMWEGGGGR